MSYQRYGYPLKYFKTGESESYVFCHVGGYVEDYNDNYEDNKSLIDLVGRIILCETKDEKYAWKMVKVLAKKFDVEDDLRAKPLGLDEWIDMLIFKESDNKTKYVKNNADSKKICEPKST
jgi:hypothetical protein